MARLAQVQLRRDARRLLPEPRARHEGSHQRDVFGVPLLDLRARVDLRAQVVLPEAGDVELVPLPRSPKRNLMRGRVVNEPRKLSAGRRGVPRPEVPEVLVGDVLVVVDPRRAPSERGQRDRVRVVMHQDESEQAHLPVVAAACVAGRIFRGAAAAGWPRGYSAEAPTKSPGASRVRVSRVRGPDARPRAVPTLRARPRRRRGRSSRLVRP